MTSWNTLIGAVNTGIQYNSSTSTAGNLVGDTSVDLVQQQLLSAIGSSMTWQQRTGQLAVDWELKCRMTAR